MHAHRTWIALAVGLIAPLVLSLVLTPRAEAFIYYVNYGYPVPGYHTAIARAQLDGTGVTERFIEVAPGDFEPIGGVAIDAEHIYWATRSGCSATCSPAPAIARAELDGSPVEDSFITVEGNPGGIAVDARHLYWGDEDGIARANLDGTGVDPSFITPPAAPAADIAVDAGHIYWTQRVVPGPNPLPTTAIGRADLDGTGVDETFITIAAPYSAGLAVDAEHIYWNQSAYASFDGATIGRANLDGSGVNGSFIQAPGHALAADAGHLYWGGVLAGPHPVAWIGRANIDGTGVDPDLVKQPGGQVGAVAVNFSVGKLRTANARGTAKLTLDVPAPGGIALAQTKDLKGAKVRAETAGKVRLAIKPRGAAKRKLARRGRARAEAEITYTPEGGAPEAQVATLRLKR